MTETLRAAEALFEPLEHIVGNMALLASALKEQSSDPAKLLNIIDLGNLGVVGWRPNETTGEMFVRIFERDGEGLHFQSEVDCEFKTENGSYVLADKPGAFVITSLATRGNRLVQRYFAIEMHTSDEAVVHGSEGDVSISLTSMEAQEYARLTDDFVAALRQKA